MSRTAHSATASLPLLLPEVKVNTHPTDVAPIKQEPLAKFNGRKWDLFGTLFVAYVVA